MASPVNYSLKPAMIPGPDVCVVIAAQGNIRRSTPLPLHSAQQSIERVFDLARTLAFV